MRTLLVTILLALVTGCQSVPEPEAPGATTASEQSKQQAPHRDIGHHLDRAMR